MASEVDLQNYTMLDARHEGKTLWMLYSNNLSLRTEKMVWNINASEELRMYLPDGHRSFLLHTGGKTLPDKLNGAILAPVLLSKKWVYAVKTKADIQMDSSEQAVELGFKPISSLLLAAGEYIQLANSSKLDSRTRVLLFSGARGIRAVSYSHSAEIGMLNAVSLPDDVADISCFETILYNETRLLITGHVDGAIFLWALKGANLEPITHKLPKRSFFNAPVHMFSSDDHTVVVRYKDGEERKIVAGADSIESLSPADQIKSYDLQTISSQLSWSVKKKIFDPSYLMDMMLPLLPPPTLLSDSDDSLPLPEDLPPPPEEFTKFDSESSAMAFVQDTHWYIISCATEQIALTTSIYKASASGLEVLHPTGVSKPDPILQRLKGYTIADVRLTSNGQYHYLLSSATNAENTVQWALSEYPSHELRIVNKSAEYRYTLTQESPNSASGASAEAKSNCYNERPQQFSLLGCVEDINKAEGTTVKWIYADSSKAKESIKQEVVGAVKSGDISGAADKVTDAAQEKTEGWFKGLFKSTPAFKLDEWDNDTIVKLEVAPNVILPAPWGYNSKGQASNKRESWAIAWDDRKLYTIRLGKGKV